MIIREGPVSGSQRLYSDVESVALRVFDPRRGNPIRAGRWQPLVIHGDATALVGWEPPRWDYDAIEA